MINKKIIVIGGNGFIGSNLLEYFSDKYAEVYSFDLLPPRKSSDVIRYIEGDFFDKECLEEAIKDKDIIIHSLSIMNPGNSNTKYMQGYSEELIQSIRLFELVEKYKSKLIYLSSGGTVYGTQEKQPISENQLAIPINHYGCIKLCIENVLRTFNAQKNTQMYIARVSNPYGPGQDYKKGVGFIDAVIKKTLEQEPIEIWGDGEVIRDYVYIEDVCKMVHALSGYEGDTVTFNVSSGVGYSQNELIELLKAEGYNPVVNYKDMRSVDVKKIVLANDKMMAITKVPLTTIVEGINKYINSLNK